MLKILASICILAGVTGFGMDNCEQMKRHLQQMIGFRECLYMLACEIRYFKRPLSDALFTVSMNGEPCYSAIFQLISEKMRGYEGTCGSAIWEECFCQGQKDLLCTREEFEILLRTGHFLDAPDIEMKNRELELYEEQLEQKINEIQKNMNEKRKLCMYGSVLGGVFLIILFL